MNHSGNYTGLRTIILARCSTFGQAEDSIPQQLSLLNRFAKDHGMIVIDTVTSEGVSGSQPGTRTDLEDLFLRAKSGEFDALLFQSYDRLTRRGAEAGIEIVNQFKSLGVRCISMNDDIPADNEFGWLMRGIRLHEGKAYAKALSFAVTRGHVSHMLEGKITHCMCAPYGIDRLYTTDDGTPLHVIRDLPDGRQVKIDPHTGAHLIYFAANEKGKVNRYVKQPSERVTFIPGSDDSVNTIRHIFRSMFIDGKGITTIARELNTLGIVSRNGKTWADSIVKTTLANPTYLGRGLANKVYMGSIHKRDKDGPKLVPERVIPPKKRFIRRKDGDDPKHRVHVPVVYRPESEWLWIDYPLLKGYLDFEPAIMEKIAAWQIDVHAKLARGEVGLKTKPNYANKDRHKTSDFILKTVMRSREGGYPMTGRSSPPHGEGKKRFRYYYITRSMRNPVDGSKIAGGIDAYSLEESVLALLEEVCRSEDLTTDIARAVEEKISESQTSRSSVQSFQDEKRQIEGRLLAFLDYDVETQKLGAKKREELEGRLRVVTRQIEAATRAGEVIDVEAVSKTVAGQMAKIGKTVREMPSPAVQRVVEALIPKMEADVQKKEVWLDVSVPVSVMRGSSVLSDLCLDQFMNLPVLVQANREESLLLAKYHCTNSPRTVQLKGTLKIQGQCISCTRVPRDAETAQTSKKAA